MFHEYLNNDKLSYVDYLMLLFFIFSKYGFFSNEHPINEDWGSVKTDSIHLNELTTNCIPQRKIFG